MAYALGSRTAVQQDCLALILKMVGEYVHRRHCGPCTCTCRPAQRSAYITAATACLLRTEVYELAWAADQTVTGTMYKVRTLMQFAM